MDHQSSASHDSLTGDPVVPARRARHWWVWVLVLLAFAGLFYWVFVLQKKPAALATGGGRRFVGVVPVTIAQARKGSVGIYAEAIGTVTPLYTDSITAQVTGVITQVHYREGQLVNKGDPLVDIDPRPYEAQLQQAEGALERDQNALAEAQMDLDRYKAAWAKNAIPRQTLEDQEKVVAQEQGTVKNDEGVVAYDKVQLGYCHITSPIDGHARVGLRLVDPGNLVTANSSTTLVVVTQEQPTTVVFTLAEDTLPQVLEQTRAGKTLRVDAYDRSQQGHLAQGKLTSIDNQIDTTTGTIKLRAQFDNRDGSLFPNQFVNTRLLIKTLDDQILVPSSAIQHNGNQDFLYALKVTKTGKWATSESDCGPPAGAPNAGAGQGSSHQAAPGAGGQQPGNSAPGRQGQPPANPGQAAPPQGGQHPQQAGGTPSGPQQAGPRPLCSAVMLPVTSGVSDQGETTIQGNGIFPGIVVANSSFEKLQNGSDVSISRIKLPGSPDTSASTAP
jgi:multidrug efflux system membrane fusion protein